VAAAALAAVLLVGGVLEADAQANVTAGGAATRVADRWLVLTNPDGVSTCEGLAAQGRPAPLARRLARFGASHRGVNSRRRRFTAGDVPPNPPPAPLLNPPAWRKIEFLERQLAADGLAFDVVMIDRTSAARPDLRSVLWNANGTGKYRGIYT
jgi:hypothetical protein